MKLCKAVMLLGILSDCANVSFRQPRQAVGHDDDDRHAIEPAPHNKGFFKTSSSYKKMSLTEASGIFP